MSLVHGMEQMEWRVKTWNGDYYFNQCMYFGSYPFFVTIAVPVYSQSFYSSVDRCGLMIKLVKLLMSAAINDNRPYEGLHIHSTCWAWSLKDCLLTIVNKTGMAKFITCCLATGSIVRQLGRGQKNKIN